MTEHTDEGNCRHFWRSLAGTNDYECDCCGAVKHDGGRVTGGL